MDPYARIDAILIFACGLLALLKITCFRIYSDNLSSNFKSAINDYFAVDNEEKRFVMRRHAFMGRMICYCVVCVAYVGSIFYVSLPLVIGHKSIQINGSVVVPNTIYPVPSTCSLGSLSIPTSLHILLFLWQSVVLFSISTGNLGGDSLFLAITLHVCGQMEILKVEFANFGVKSLNPKEDFSKMVTRHQHLLIQALLLCDTISSVLVLQLLISSLLICIIGFQLIVAVKVGDTIMIAKTAWVQLTLLSQIFAYSYVGDYMKSQIEEIANAIFSSNWYCFSFKMMRNVVFVIARSQDPVQLMAAKFIVINMETFMSIIKTSLSYLSVLRVMVEV
ncbi:odorant receptor 13a-like [Odontomachus brunneus]|uniref:odorant receptor 13a-like n=1 Tax=Odontomachus brunneus TaxID=486640 RepID=UPI0013F22F14|nr:odorant receptor 13a-like [Odontomachus brunneus]